MKLITNRITRLRSPYHIRNHCVDFAKEFLNDAGGWLVSWIDHRNPYSHFSDLTGASRIQGSCFSPLKLLCQWCRPG